MEAHEIAHWRMHHQQLLRTTFTTPAEVVNWLGAVQAQDYPGAKWALAQRANGLTDAMIEQAFADGQILRTHVLRPTWHFVTPADIRWMLALTAPRINAGMASYYRQFDLDDALFARSHELLLKTLQGGRQLARPELVTALEAAGIATGDLRFSFIMTRAELDGLICSGGWQGHRQTYALLAERAPQAGLPDRETALAELARRYFTSHGPATMKDYTWWSGLTAADARAGLDMVKSQLHHQVIDGQTYWFADMPTPETLAAPTVYLLPPYDEYTVAYKDRRAFLDPMNFERAKNGIFSPVIVVNGRIVGLWKRTIKKAITVVEAELFAPLGDSTAHALAAAVERYGQFLGTDVSLVLS